MATPVKFTRSVHIQNRHITAATKNQGPPRTEMDLLFRVTASLGSVQLKVRMQVVPPAPMYAANYRAIEPVNVASHFKRKLADWWMESHDCDVLVQDTCYGDTGYGLAEDVWRSFQLTEEDGWAHLERIYNAWRKPDDES
ncbi:hypothetical protein SEA_RASPUTIA_17 [Microbacterium phage Rasputia]|nr:hypothetical protein SEA_RASPUTIA_17 [Microbacterium phage Rasputia]